MHNSVSEQSFYIESEEEDEEKEFGKGEDDGNDSDSTNYSNDNRQQSRPNSLNTAWPQSYRQSIDLYSSVPSPSITFLGTPTLSRLGSSFLSSSLIRRHTPEIFPEATKPLLPTVEDEQKPHQRRSSHSLLPPIPSRRGSVRKSKVSHELPVSRQSSFGQAVVNGMNVLCGVGILSTPYAVKEGGWAGLSILVIFAVLSCYTGLLLRRCLDSQPGLETYPDIGQAAFGNVGRFAISIILYAELYACCVEYIILESDNLSSLFPNWHLHLGGLYLNSHHLFALLATLAILPTVWLRDLTVLSYISVGGVLASILVVLCLFWVGLVDKVGFQTKGTTLNLATLPVAIGLYGYCYSGHAVFPNIYTSMEKPSQFSAVLLTSFGICTLMYAGTAVMGYLMFGESTQSQFTLNLPEDLVATKIAVWTTVVNPFTKYALTMTPVAMSLEELIPSNRHKSHIYAILIRTALVISTLVVGLVIPFFGLVMALIGSLLTMLVALILPCACYLSILRGKTTRLQIILYAELYACCVEYIILESDNLSSLFPNARLNLGGFVMNSHQLFALLATIAILPTVWLRDLTMLSYISVGGVIASILAVLCLFWVGLVEKVGFQTKGAMLNLTTLPVAIGLYGYCYSGHAVFPNIYASMQKKSQFPAVLLTCFVVCTLMYAGVAVMGYLMFGESALSQFTLNLPHDLVAAKIAVWTTVVNPFTKYALTMTPIAMCLEELMPSNILKSHKFAILIRTALVISTLVVGLTVPFFGPVMALIGSLLTMLITLILPCACYLSILRGKTTRFQVSVCILIIAVGVVSAVFGTSSALSNIVENLRS